MIDDSAQKKIRPVTSRQEKTETLRRNQVLKAMERHENGFIYRPGERGAVVCGRDRDFSGELVMPETLGGQRVCRIEDVFRDCGDLQSLVIPACVSEVAGDIFGFCRSLKAFRIAHDNPDLCSVDGVLFSRDMTRLLQYPEAKAGAYAVPAGVTAIRLAAFAHSHGLTSITLPDSLTSIGFSAFSMCARLESASLPSGLAKLDDGVFSDCTALRRIDIPESVEVIENGAFDSCTSLAGVVLPSRLRRLGLNTFSGCNSLARVSIPAAVVEIGYGAFSDCASLTSIEVDAHNPVFHSQGGVLFDRIKAELVQFPAGRAGSYSAPEGTVSILGRAFSGCARLTGLILPESVSAIGCYAFADSAGLQSITLPGALQSINEGALSGCTNLREVRIPASVSKIFPHAFTGCTALESLVCKGQIWNAAERTLSQ